MLLVVALLLSSQSQCAATGLHTMPLEYTLTGVAAAQQELHLDGQGTVIAVLDTGVNYKHPAFGDCQRPGKSGTCRVYGGFDFVGDTQPQDILTGLASAAPDADPVSCCLCLAERHPTATNQTAFASCVVYVEFFRCTCCLLITSGWHVRVGSSHTGLTAAEAASCWCVKPLVAALRLLPFQCMYSWKHICKFVAAQWVAKHWPVAQACDSCAGRGAHMQGPWWGAGRLVLAPWTLLLLRGFSLVASSSPVSVWSTAPAAVGTAATGTSPVVTTAPP